MIGEAFRGERVLAPLRRWAPVMMLASACVAFRLPVLMNAKAVNSDAAIVGLQARHMLKGEWSLFLWGAGYQSSIDALMTALAYVVIGFRPIALAGMPLVAHLIFTWLAWDILRRRLGTWKGAFAVLPLVFTPM